MTKTNKCRIQFYSIFIPEKEKSTVDRMTILTHDCISNRTQVPISKCVKLQNKINIILNICVHQSSYS